MEKLIDTIINLIERNKYEEALTECSRFVFLYPLNPIGYELRGDCFLYFKKYQLAFMNYREAISLTNATDVKSKNNLSLLYKKKGICNLKSNNLKEAVEDFTNSINFNPDNYEAYHLRSKSLRKLGKFDLALQDANKAIELFSEYAEAYNNRGCIYYMTNRPDEAIKDLTKAIELKPEYGGAYYNRSLVYSNLKKDYQQAKQDLEKAEALRARKSSAPLQEKISEEVRRETQDPLKSYEEKREKFSNITLEEGAKLSEGLFETVEPQSNVVDIKGIKQSDTGIEEKSFSDVFTTEKESKPTKSDTEKYAVEEVLEAKHKSESLPSPFTDSKEEKSLDDLISDLKIPEELKELHNQIVLPPQKEELKEPEVEVKQENLETSKVTQDSKELEELKTTPQPKSTPEKIETKVKTPVKPYSKYLYDEPKKNYAMTYIVVGTLILLIIIVGIFLVKMLQNKDSISSSTGTEQTKKVFIIYEREDTSKITLKEDFEKVMAEKGLVLVVLDDGYKFQAGSFKDSNYAVSRMEWLEEQEFEPEIQTLDLKEKGKFFRVRFGDFQTIEEADSVAKTIK